MAFPVRVGKNTFMPTVRSQVNVQNVSIFNTTKSCINFMT